ncbi:MAG: hypothetical protein IKI93_19570, partial [Clostridia bacterium]|nr:hypothetical protein [Clostridia bacterium]
QRYIRRTGRDTRISPIRLTDAHESLSRYRFQPAAVLSSPVSRSADGYRTLQILSFRSSPFYLIIYYITRKVNRYFP